MSAKGYLAGLSGLLRRFADRLDPRNTPRAICGHSFTFEHEVGIRFRTDGRGCPLWVLGEDDYERAHDEADTRHVRVDWTMMRHDWRGGEVP